MLIYLMRHGMAEPPAAGGDDSAGALTPAGVDQVQKQAGLLQRAGLGIEQVFTSPYLRARQTAALVADAFGLTAEPDVLLQPGCTLDGVDALLGREGRPSGTVLLVGHQPDLGRLVQLLTLSTVVVRPGTVAVIETAVLRAGRGVLRGLYDPDVMAAWAS